MTIETYRHPKTSCASGQSHVQSLSSSEFTNKQIPFWIKFLLTWTISYLFIMAGIVSLILTKENQTKAKTKVWKMQGGNPGLWKEFKNNKVLDLLVYD